MPTNYNYNQTIPFATNKPSVDQPNMETNTNSTYSIIGTDHLTFNTATGSFTDGMHTVVHLVNDAVNPRTRSGAGAVTANFPAPMAGVNTIFDAQYTPDSSGATGNAQLFSIPSGGSILQLTGALTNDPTDGHAWVGGILLQWGFVDITLPAGIVTFKDRVPGAIPFPNNIFNIQATFTRKASSGPTGSATIWIRKNTNPEPKVTEFTWVISGSNGATTPDGFYWFAIGN